MNSGDVFSFNGDKFVARAKIAEGWLTSRMKLNKNGEERPTVGKPRLFKYEQLQNPTIVGHYNLDKPKPRSAPAAEKNEEPTYTATPSPDEEKSPEEIAADLERRREAVARMIQKTASASADNEDWGATL